ncbi:hypothetical protein H6F96_15615 [Microcoleus sp. FACHB-53]|nr:hypothetical protein [Microcoleus sp. FACHB-53]
MKLANSAVTKIVITGILSAASLPLSITAVMAESPAMNITEYELSGNTVEECVSNAERVMKEEGVQDFNSSSRDVFGSAGDTSIEMYCVRDGKTLILVLAGSNSEELRKLQIRIDKRLSQ